MTQFVVWEKRFSLFARNKGSKRRKGLKSLFLQPNALLSLFVCLHVRTCIYLYIHLSWLSICKNFIPNWFVSIQIQYLSCLSEHQFVGIVCPSSISFISCLTVCLCSHLNRYVSHSCSTLNNYLLMYLFISQYHCVFNLVFNT